MNSAVRVVGAAELVLARLDRDVEPLDVCGALLSAQEIARARRLRRDTDRRRYIVARSKLRRLLAERCEQAPESLPIGSAMHGKPVLRGTRLQFSVSRSGELAAYAFAWDRAVGIDVEAVRAMPDADAIAERTFPRAEWRAYDALAARDRVAGFFRGWTRTEALAKALGWGLTLAPEALDAALACGLCTLHSFAPAPGFAGAVACSHPGAYG